MLWLNPDIRLSKNLTSQMFQWFFYFSSLSLTALFANLAYLRDASMDKKMPTFLKSEFKSTPYKQCHGIFYVDALSASASPNACVYMLLKSVLIRARQRCQQFFADIEKHQGTPKKTGATWIWLKGRGKWVKNMMGHKQFLMAVIELTSGNRGDSNLAL